MTKKEAAVRVWYTAQCIRKELEGAVFLGGEEADLWVSSLEQMARDLDPKNERYEHRWIEPKESRWVKLWRLIEHEGTTEPERAAALSALRRLRARAAAEAF